MINPVITASKKSKQKILKKGMKKEAIKYWKKALKLNPNNEKLELIVNKAEAEIIQKKN